MKNLIALLLLAALACTAAAAPTKRESFDLGWKFARFGKMPDGSYLPEPGAPTKMVTASSEEAANPASNAIDNNPDTRWCASSGAKGQTLTLDLGASARLSGIQIDWEKPSENPFKIDVSEDGRQWREAVSRRPIGGTADQKLPYSGSARYIRVTADGSNGAWASIRELAALDASGKPITPKPADSAGASARPEDVAFNDSSWRSLDLPHDWAIEGPFRMEIENETGKLPWEGIGWYRKTFTVPASLGADRLFLDFDGAMAQPKIYVNGKLAGEWAYGYTSFRIDITPFVKPGAQNIVAVRLQNLPQSTRWYPGAGIYRHVYLTTAPPTAIGHWGVYVTTPKITDAAATVHVETSVDNAAPDKQAALRVSQEILDGASVVASGSANLAVPSGDTKSATSDIEVKQPKRWDLKTPNLYTLRTRIYDGSTLVDEKSTSFGIREIAWDAQKGFLLNGKKVELNGVCQHHDLGPLGAAVYTRAIERQIEILKEMGVNSIRTSHNPPAPELLELCDRMGVLVIDELFDIWKLQKYGKVNGYNTLWDKWHEKDTTNFVLRDRNHASIIAWSTGNEIPELGRPDMLWVPEKLREIIRKYDTTRMITAGSNDPGASKNGFQTTVDVFGLNYHIGSYDSVQNNLPDKPLYASETSSTVSTRGEYFFPVSWDASKGFFDFQVSSYDLYAPGWAYRPDLEFEALDKHPRYAGEYVWTGFDYLGEPTPYNQDQTNALNFQNPEDRKKAMEELQKLGNRAPSRSSYFGIVDLCGFKKDRFYLYQSRWLPEKPMAHILPHWNWPDRVGQKIPVHVYTSGDQAELFLNGKSLGVRKKGDPQRYRLVWEDVTYQPGVLKVVATKNGKPWAEDTMATTGDTASLGLEADRPAIAADGRDLSYLTVRALDRKGNVVPRTHMPLTIAASGPLEIIGICNGDPTDLTTMKPADPRTASIRIFNGMAQIVVRSRRGEAGAGKIRVTSGSLPAAEVSVTTK